ncbi:MAG TPA: LUD domain-containing protein [Pyrinomonadaceae bacterium]|nr:LUD domain-containing protein [Pyrinomonadaceae bacterium]
MNNSAREAILGSIRTHLAASPVVDDHPVNPANPVILSKSDPVNRFKESVESVAGHCIITTDVTDSLNQIITDLNAQRIAYSDNPPNAHDIFHFDVGISTAQAAIAETGTLVLDSACERHRLVSLVPPVHIAIINASAIVETLSDALTFLQKKEISPAITFITGPSRTADIELTLAIGVHGPQELYVIVDGSK